MAIIGWPNKVFSEWQHFSKSLVSDLLKSTFFVLFQVISNISRLCQPKNLNSDHNLAFSSNFTSRLTFFVKIMLFKSMLYSYTRAKAKTPNNNNSCSQKIKDDEHVPNVKKSTWTQRRQENLLTIKLKRGLREIK